MVEETITFELIRKIQREEQTLPKLSRLQENFFDAVAAYLEHKRRMVRDDKKDVLELKNIERLVEDIVNRRERKILNAAIISARTKITPENLSEEEKVFYASLHSIIKGRREVILKTFSEVKQVEPNVIIFKEDSPEFVGSDMRTYGPFKKGEATILPEANVKILMEKGIVEEFKSQK